MSTHVGAKYGWLVLAAATAAFSFASSAQATPVNYDFTVNVLDGPLSGTAVNGSFSYDSSSITPSVSIDAKDLLTTLDFTFNGISYDAATANTGWLEFDAAGSLHGFGFGTGCWAGICVVSSGSNGWSITQRSFTYSTPSNWIGLGSVTYALAPVEVPEPGTLGLFGLGALVVGLLAGRRRRMYQANWLPQFRSISFR
jgi:hypothetical protein